MKCKSCNKKYVGKSEWPSYIRLNNHRKDSKRENAIPAVRHFNKAGPNFDRDAKFTIIEQLRNSNQDKKGKRKISKHKEDFWILNLKTL